MTTETQEQPEATERRGEASDLFSDLLDCKCGAKAETWLESGWVFTGCKRCGTAVAAYKNFKQSQDDWNKCSAI